MEYLKERASKEIQLREQELEMRKKEHDRISQREREKNEQQDKMLSAMLNQQEKKKADDDDVFQSAATTITGFTFLDGKNCSKVKHSYFYCLLFGYTEDQFSLSCPYFRHVIS